MRRPSLTPYVLAAFLGMGLAFCAPQPAHADGLYHEIVSRDSVHIADKACTDSKVLRYLGAEAPKYFAAYTHRYGESHNACWTPMQVMSEGEKVLAIRLVEDNGRVLMMPAAAFKPAPEA